MKGATLQGTPKQEQARSETSRPGLFGAGMGEGSPTVLSPRGCRNKQLAGACCNKGSARTTAKELTAFQVSERTDQYTTWKLLVHAMEIQPFSSNCRLLRHAVTPIASTCVPEHRIVAAATTAVVVASGNMPVAAFSGAEAGGRSLPDSRGLLLRETSSTVAQTTPTMRAAVLVPCLYGHMHGAPRRRARPGHCQHRGFFCCS